MSKVKEREEQKSLKTTGFQVRDKVKKQAYIGPVVVAPIKEHFAVVVEQSNPARFDHGNQFVGIRFDQQSFEAEERESVAQVDRYSRFIDHVLDSQKDEADLADWSIKRAANRKKH